MILVDTSVWIDHLRAGDEELVGLLEDGRVLCHAFVIGEIALGSLRQRSVVLESLAALPMAVAASDAEVLALVDASELWSSGIGWVDAHLLAATRLTPGSRLLTRDRKLNDAAVRLKLA